MNEFFLLSPTSHFSPHFYEGPPTTPSSTKPKVETPNAEPYDWSKEEDEHQDGQLVINPLDYDHTRDVTPADMKRISGAILAVYRD